MPVELEPNYAEKHNIVQNLFIATADDNYITARWCYAEALNVDFFWLAAHALEKYMKAVLLLNGQSGKSYVNATGNSKPFAHNIEVLYEHVRRLAGDLLPSTLSKPDRLETSYWHVETAERFVKRLHDYGNADNRYQIFGFVQMPSDLYKLDQMVFAIRRLCKPLDAYLLGKKRDQAKNPSNRDILTANPLWWDSIGAMPLEKTIAGKRGKRLQRVVLNLNLPFAPKGYRHIADSSRSSSQNPVLYRAIFERLKSANISQRQLGQELRDWAIANIKLPGDVEKQLQNAKPPKA